MSTERFEPLADRLLIKVIEAPDMTDGGLFLPEQARERPQEGLVLAAGPGRLLEDGRTLPNSIQTGDKVLFGKYSGTELKVSGEECLIIREDEVIGKMVSHD